MPAKLISSLPKHRRAKGTTLKHRPPTASTFKAPYDRPGEVAMSMTVYARHPRELVCKPKKTKSEKPKSKLALLVSGRKPLVSYMPAKPRFTVATVNESLAESMCAIDGEGRTEAMAAREVRVKEQAVKKEARRREFEFAK